MMIRRILSSVRQDEASSEDDCVAREAAVACGAPQPQATMKRNSASARFRGALARHRRNQQGFTIVEVLVALLILLLVGTVAVQFAVSAIHTSYQQQQRATAMTLSTSGMEKVRSRIRGMSGDSYLASITAGTTKDQATQAYNALKADDVVRDGDFQLAWSDGTAPASGSIAYSAVDTTSSADTNGTEFKVYTVVGKCYRIAKGNSSSNNAACSAIDTSSMGIPEYVDCDNGTSDELTAAITDPTKCAKGAFKLGSATYEPMLRVTVAVEWQFGGFGSSGEKEVYATSEYLDCSPEVDIIVKS